MRDQYVILAHDGTETGASRMGAVLERLLADDGLDHVYEGERLSVFATASLRRAAFADGRGFVLGPLFDTGNGNTCLTTCDELIPTLSRAVDWDFLFREYWGSYVAVSRDSKSRQWQIRRAPFGSLACYYVQTEHITAIVSDMEMLSRAGLRVPELNWSQVGRFLLSDQYRDPVTCLEGVQELPGGGILTLGGVEPVMVMGWSPWTCAVDPVRIGEEELAALLRTTVIQSVAAWSCLFRHVLLGLSGGLDSSIVAAALSEASACFSCLTLFTSDATGDEREFARATSDVTGSALYERIEDVASVDLTRSDAADLPRPVARAFAQSGDAHFQDIATQIGADAFFSGGGGDNVFCFLQSAAPVADRLLVEGIGRGALRTAADMAQMSSVGVGRAFAKGIERAWFRSPEYRWPIDRSFMSSEFVSAHEIEFTHPWLRLPPRALPGKAGHIALIMAFFNHVDGFGRERMAPRVTPLLSQPIVELCLRIPTWLSCSGGRNRSVARAAFRANLAPRIANRTSKGTPGSFVLDIFQRKMPQVKAMLNDGVLAAHELIDLDAVNRIIARAATASDLQILRIMRLVDVEAWATARIARQ